jgi:hypothetical protein
MQIALVVAVSAVALTSLPAPAQNASTGSTVTTGDSAVSPASGDPATAGSPSANRQNPGAGVASGVLNNGTTGDTIGTGSGTSTGSAAGTAARGTTASSPAAGRKD